MCSKKVDGDFQTQGPSRGGGCFIHPGARLRTPLGGELGGSVCGRSPCSISDPHLSSASLPSGLFSTLPKNYKPQGLKRKSNPLDSRSKVKFLICFILKKGEGVAVRRPHGTLCAHRRAEEPFFPWPSQRSPPGTGSTSAHSSDTSKDTLAVCTCTESTDRQEPPDGRTPHVYGRR